MKKVLFCLFTLAISNILIAQKQKETNIIPDDYNRWSIDVNGGFSNPSSPFSTAAYGDLGVRYMLSNKFGLKTDFGFNLFKNTNNSSPFDANYYRTSLQAYINLGRVLNFETWTKTINLMPHFGTGFSWMTFSNTNGIDYMSNFMAGLTGQIKLTNRISLNADFSVVQNVGQDLIYDSYGTNPGTKFNGLIYNTSLGLSFYLGHSQKHADWAFALTQKDNTERFVDLERQISELREMLNDTDRDGVLDCLDKEPNTVNGVAVDTNGRAIDLNNNNIPDELERYVSNSIAKVKKDIPTEQSYPKLLINEGYIAAYFDFNQIKPNDLSTEGISFVRNYLKENPNSTITIYGHSDEVGDDKFNNDLAMKRADSVKAILIKSGITENRIKVVSSGEDYSIDSKSIEARKLIRKVTFKVNG